VLSAGGGRNGRRVRVEKPCCAAPQGNLSHSHSRSLTLNLFLSHTHTDALSLSLSVSLSLSHTHTSVARLRQKAQWRVDSSTGDEKTGWLDASVFLGKVLGRKGGMHMWLQAASQEPDASFLSRGSKSTAPVLGLRLVQWVGKPQGRGLPKRYHPGKPFLVLEFGNENYYTIG